MNTYKHTATDEYILKIALDLNAQNPQYVYYDAVQSVLAALDAIRTWKEAPDNE